MQLNYYVLGQRIQKIRKNKRISQAVLSTMIDKSAGYISYLECGTKVMSLETFVGIANALEVSTDKVFIAAAVGAGINDNELRVFKVRTGADELVHCLLIIPVKPENRYQGNTV